MLHKFRFNSDTPSSLPLFWRYPLILGAIFGLFLFAVVVQLSVNERERDFMVAAEGAGIDFREHLEEGENVINNIVLFFNASSHVTDDEFSLFISSQFNTHLDIKSVYFLANKGGDNRYAREAAGLPQTVAILGEGEDYLLHRLYHVGHPDNRFSELGWEAWNEPNTVQTIARTVAQGMVTMGEVITLDDGSIAFSQYKAIYADGGGGELLGVIAILFRPADVLLHITEDYRVNVALSVAEQTTGVSVCCREVGELLLPTFSVDDAFEYRGMPFHLHFSKGLGWDGVYIKVAVLAFVIGALLVMVMRRLRMANMARTQMLVERNRTIKRQVEEQTRAVRQANTELVQQKAALDEHAIVSIADTSGDIIYVNDKFCEISGYHHDELVGRNHRIIKSDRHPSEFYDEMWSTISQGKVWHGEVCNRSKGGEEYWVNSTIVPFLDERGLPYQYASIRTDITALKAAKLAIMAHESELNTILNTVPALIWYKDRDSNIVRANEAAAALAGLTPEEMAGRPHSDFFPPDVVQRYRADDLKVLESEEPLLDLREGLDSSDEIHHFRVDRVPYRDEAGAVIGLIVMASDITRQEEAEQALLINEERLRRSQTFANIGTWDWNIQSGDLYWSERIAPLFGYKVGELDTTYENFLNAVHPDDRDLVSEAVGACVESGAEYNIEHRVVWPDGQVRWLSEKGDVVRDASGAPLRMLGVVQDIHDRKMAEAGLAESERQLREAQSLARIGNWQADLVNGELVWSDEIYRIFGYEPGSFNPSVEAFQAAVHPDDIEQVRESEKRAEQTGHHDVVHRIVRPDGTIRHVHELAQAETNKQGHLIRLRGTVQDITERVEAEIRMRESEERFVFAVEGAGDGIWDWDMHSNAMQFSHLYMAMLGYEDNELPQHADTWVGSVHPDDMPRVQQNLQDYLEGRIPLYAIELRLRCKDGSYKWILCRGTVVSRDDEGKPIRMIGIHSDISERKQSEEALSRFKTTLDVTQDCVFMFAPDTLRFFYVNQGAMEQVGYSKDELKQMCPYDIKPDYDEAAFRELIEPLIASGGGSLTFETNHQHKNGQIIPVEIGLQYIAPAGEQPRFVGIVRNISERRVMQEKLVEAKEAAEQGSKAKSEFLSSMSHELRTPMNAIIGFAELMTDDENLTAEQHESLNEISSAGTHLLDLINEVLDLSKIEAGKMKLSMGRVAVRDVLVDAQNLITSMAEKHDIKLIFSPSCLDGCFVYADFTRTKQVLLNLLSNAVKYNRNGGTIQVECQEVENSRLRISVSDTGEGIPEVRLRGLFEAFNRLDAEGGDIEGTGIGLVITRQLVELMGGEMGVESVVGEGSTFWFELPCAEGPVAEKKVATVEKDSNIETLGAGRTVLYIEDNPVNLKLVSMLIKKRTAINLLSAEEPIQGIDLAVEQKPDLILLDINLPEMNGYEVLRHLRDMESTRDIPVVALSANAMADDLQRGEEAGFDGYLTKPINVKEFFSVLEKILG